MRSENVNSQNFTDRVYPLGIRIGFQYNSFRYEMDIQQMKGRKKSKTNTGIIREKFGIKVSIAGVGLAFGSMQRKAAKFKFWE